MLRNRDFELLIPETVEEALAMLARDDRSMARWLWRFLQNYRRSLGARRLAWRLRSAHDSNPRVIDRPQ